MNNESHPLPEIAMMTANELADVLQMEYDDRVPRSILVCFVTIMDNAHMLLHGTRLVSDSITLDPSGHPLIPSLSDSRRAITDEEVAPMALPFIKEQMGPAMNTAMEQAVRWEQELNEGGGHDEAVIEEVASVEEAERQAIPDTSNKRSTDPKPPSREEFTATRSDVAIRAYSKLVLYVAHVSLALTFFALAASLMFSPFYMIGFLAAATLSVFAYVAGFEARRYRVPSWVLLRDIKAHKVKPEHRQRVHGTAGDLSGAAGKFSEANIAAGEAGEKATALLLDDLAQVNGVRVFHGMNWPGTDEADIDHIVMAGTRIAVIDSKMWSGIAHSMGEDGRVTSTLNGKSEGVHRPIHIHEATNALMGYMGGGFQVQTFLAVHSPNDSTPTFQSAPGAPVSMDSAENTIEAVREFILGAPSLGRILVDDIDRLSALRRPSPKASKTTKSAWSHQKNLAHTVGK